MFSEINSCVSFLWISDSQIEPEVQILDSFQQLINAPLGPASLQDEFDDMNVSSQGLKAALCYMEVQVYSPIRASSLTHADFCRNSRIS